MAGHYFLAGSLVVLVTLLLVFGVSDIGDEDALARYQQGVPLRVGYALEPPFAMIDDEGRVTGEAPEVLRHLLRELGDGPVVWIHVPFADLIHELESGRIDIIASGFFVTPERAERVLFTQPKAWLKPGLLVSGDNPLGLFTLHDIAAQPSARLAVLAGAVEYDAALRAGIPTNRILSLPDVSSAIAALLTGRVDSLALSVLSLERATEALGSAVQIIALERGAGIDAELPLGQPAFAVRHADRRLRDALDQALADLVGTDEHLALVQPFGFTKPNLIPPSGDQRR
ncbi:transporter substrate-binding domain-containing protein [Thioalkalicoccus limnaeus]|uniref:Transporter substrate-binding domain-containing protein n=1 Tax=Thioalkalicoccus limnaeus TaxID=120681 RepID=A0ABV4BDD6_9GAMM